MELRDYQREVFDLIDNNTEYAFQLPCGTGKNVIISEYINRHPEYKYVVFSPSIYLANEMCRLINRPVNRIFSDKPTEEVHDISICVYNSWKKLQNDYDILFIDEAHHFENGAWEMEECVISRKYFFSATLEIPNYKYDHSKAVKNNYIVNFNMNIYNVVDEESMLNVVKVLQNNPNYKHVIAYCNEKVLAVMLTIILKDHGIAAECVHSGMYRKDINRNINDFKENKIRVLVNCYLINEGVDIKICDCALFYNNRRSEVQIVQCIGRMQRLFPEKTIGNFICFLGESAKSISCIKKYLKVIFINSKYFENDNKITIKLINERDDQEETKGFKTIRKIIEKIN